MATTVSKAIVQSKAQSSNQDQHMAPEAIENKHTDILLSATHKSTEFVSTHDSWLQNPVYTDTPCESHGSPWKLKASMWPASSPSFAPSSAMPPVLTDSAASCLAEALDSIFSPSVSLSCIVHQHKLQGPALTSTGTVSDSPKAAANHPEPPPPPSPSRLTYKQRRSPLFEFQLIVKRMSLSSPAMALPGPGTRDSFLVLLNTACSYRHISPRSLSTDEQQPSVRPPVPADEGLERVLEWLGQSSEGRHQRTTSAIRCCIDFLTLYLGARTGDDKMGMSENNVLSSCILPLLEENLTVGIEDMENQASLFRSSISLVYELSRFGKDSAMILGPISSQWRPAQRKSILHLCEDIDKLVGEYLTGMKGGGEGYEERFFEMVRFVADCVREACKASTAQVNLRASAGRGEEEKIYMAAAEWRSSPSVISWFPGGGALPLSVEALDAAYEEEMVEHKLEGEEALRDTHYFKGHGNEQAMPARMARKLMQELVAMRRDLPLGRREGIILRYDEQRADFIKILIFGSAETPYAAGCFEYHIYCPPAYPDVAPSVWLITTGMGRVRFNPNLYEDGLVCSSLLNQGSGWGHVT